MGDNIETPLIRVPFESLKRITRDRKYVVEAADQALEKLQQCTKTKDNDVKEQRETLQQVVKELQGLKRKLDTISQAEQDELQRLKARLAHLAEIRTPSRGEYIDWNRQRLDRLIVDHLLRCGYHNTAAKLIEAAQVQDVVDVHIFVGARQVVESLRLHDCSVALTWCEENRAKLRKSKSKLEFCLRVQEFIELVRVNRMQEAIAYARRHFPQFAKQHMSELQHAVATLAFKADTACKAYQQLFDESQWTELVELFHKELYRLNSLTPISLLSVHLQAGLSALKTPQSLQDSCSREDPLHLSAFRKLAEGLPYAKHVHSKLVCAVTKEIIDEHNPPMVLPNGYVYSEKAVQQFVYSDDGKITCPRTGKQLCCENSSANHF